MGLFDVFKKGAAHKTAEPAAAKPAAVPAVSGSDVLAAPVAGKVIAMGEVPDPVFSSEALGKGCAIWPQDDVVYAPVSGEVTVTMDHAIGIKGENGIEVFVHIGIDTVNMNGDGFTGLVGKGDAVEAGQPVIKMDREKIAAAGHPDCVVLAVSNTADYASVELAVAAGSEVAAGAAVLTAR